ncbi:hypothetical protein RB195_017387 [Necator americanus]|uniref:Uncharacterized protein n=1 Tax=Necator americanus TaxID=51031 RepID=A0ABR1C7D8_NECAM
MECRLYSQVLKLAASSRNDESVQPRVVVEEQDGSTSWSFFSDFGSELAELLRVYFDVDSLVVVLQILTWHSLRVPEPAEVYLLLTFDWGVVSATAEILGTPANALPVVITEDLLFHDDILQKLRMARVEQY